MKNSILIALIFNALSQVFGQNRQTPQPIDGRIIVQATPGVTPSFLQERWAAALPVEWPAGDRFTFKELAPSCRIWRVDFDENFVKKERLLEAALATPGVAAAQLDWPTEERKTEPDDPQFFKQLDFDLIRAAQAWDGSTGGLTAQGDTIVIAVLEKGIYRDHPDLRENMWKNRLEIPGNFDDDDQNGFPDDYAGWDVRNQTDGMGTVTPHGASVSGIIGARGDNAQGVAGINWNVKLMPVVNCSLTSEIIAAYNYVLIQRQLYNQSGGQRGAFVVATNASFGISGQFASAQPIWCAMYDSLGRAGVVSVGATDNANINVDIAGDLPSTCPSEHLIVVTNVGQNDVKVNGAAYGATHVDLGAPGEACWTTDFRVGTTDTVFYNAFPGTSAATPHVTGAIGWIFSLPCAKVASDALTAPEACARRVRDLLLDNVEPNSSLKDITSTGGRLDMLDILTATQAFCGSSVGELAITGVEVGANFEQITVRYQTADYLRYKLRIIDPMGRILHDEWVEPKEFEEKKVVVDLPKYLANGAYTVSISNRNGAAAKTFAKFYSKK